MNTKKLSVFDYVGITFDHRFVYYDLKFITAALIPVSGWNPNAVSSNAINNRPLKRFQAVFSFTSPWQIAANRHRIEFRSSCRKPNKKSWVSIKNSDSESKVQNSISHRFTDKDARCFIGYSCRHSLVLPGVFLVSCFLSTRQAGSRFCTNCHVCDHLQFSILIPYNAI